MKPSRYFLIIPAAGSGKRMGLESPKQFLPVQGKSILHHTLQRFSAVPGLDSMVLALNLQDTASADFLTALPEALRQRLRIVEGGAERMHSVQRALDALRGQAADDDWVLVHDAVRPCVRTADVLKLMETLASEPAGGLLALPVRDTLKLAGDDAQVLGTLDRNNVWQAATPQMFRYAVLVQALAGAQAAGVQVTDEAAAVERLGLPVKLVPGHADNIKLTWPEDMALIEALLAASSEGRD